MTCRRKPGTVEYALFSAVRALSPDTIEKATGKSESWFRKCSNPDVSHEISFSDALALDRALANAGKTRVFAPLFDEMAAASDPAFDVDSGLQSINVSLGRLCAETLRAKADGKIDAHERDAIATHADEVREKAQAIRDAMTVPLVPRVVGE